MAAARRDITVYDMLVTAGADTTIVNIKGELAARPPTSAPVPIVRPDNSEPEELMFQMTFVPR